MCGEHGGIRQHAQRLGGSDVETLEAVLQKRVRQGSTDTLVGMECFLLRTLWTNLARKHMMTPCPVYQTNWKNNWWQHGQITYSWCALTMQRARTGMKTTTVVRAKLHLPMRCTKIQEDGDVASLVIGQHQHKRCPAQPPRNAQCVVKSSHTCSDF